MNKHYFNDFLYGAIGFVFGANVFLRALYCVDPERIGVVRGHDGSGDSNKGPCCCSTVVLGPILESMRNLEVSRKHVFPAIAFCNVIVTGFTWLRHRQNGRNHILPQFGCSPPLSILPDTHKLNICFLNSISESRPHTSLVP